MFGTVRDNTLSLPVQKMGDVVEIRNGRDYKVIQNDNGRYPVYGTGGIITYADDFLCPENTVIIGRKGTIDNPLLIKEKFWNVDTAFGMICNQLILNPIYYFWFCKQYDFKKHNKATTIPSLVKADLQKIDVIVPEKYKQDLFADFVKQVDKSKAICKQIFQSFDNLVKSRFIEMFGTDVNPKYGHIKVGEVVSKKIGRVSKQFSTDSIIQYIDIASIDKDSKRILSTTEYVVSEAPSRAQQCVEEGDILLSNVRPNLRTISIVHLSGSNLVCSTGFSVLRCELYLPEYFLMAISSDSFTEHLMSKATGSSYPAVTTKDVMNQTIPAAPLELQKKFSDFVRQVDKSKFEVVQSLLKLKDSMKSSQ